MQVFLYLFTWSFEIGWAVKLLGTGRIILFVGVRALVFSGDEYPSPGMNDHYISQTVT